MYPALNIRHVLSLAPNTSKVLFFDFTDRHQEALGPYNWHNHLEEAHGHIR